MDKPVRSPVAHSFERHPIRREPLGANHHHYLIGLRQADISHVPPDQARTGFRGRRFAREAHRSAMLCPRPAYGSATGR
jgi:hypothetical protein